MATKVDWDFWRHKFVTGDLSLKEMSEGHNAPAFKTLRNKSSAEDWPSQRKRYKDMQGTQSAINPDVKATAAQVEKIIDAAEMFQRHATLAKVAGAIASYEFRTIQEKMKRKESTGLKFSDVMNLAKFAIETERLTEGLATQRQEIDLSGMSDAELEKLANGG